MEIKYYKRINNLTGFIMVFFILSDVLNYPFLFIDATETPSNNLICQGIFVLGLVCLITFYATILRTIKKEGVFISYIFKVGIKMQEEQELTI